MIPNEYNTFFCKIGSKKHAGKVVGFTCKRNIILTFFYVCSDIKSAFFPKLGLLYLSKFLVHICLLLSQRCQPL